jgi:hypothetical protein
VRYSSFSVELVASGFRRPGSLRKSGTWLGVGESKVSSGTNDVDGVDEAEVAGAAGEEVGTVAGDIGEEDLRPVRLSHLKAC